MPRQRITKEMVVEAAFEIARSQGMEQVMVKSIAGKLGCSVQPIYSYCQNMEGLRKDVADRTNQFIHRYVAAHLNREDMFRSTGQAYIQLAKEEPNLFKIFILHQREGISSLEELYEREVNPQMAKIIGDQLHISIAQARELHLNMLIYTIGLGTIFSVTTPGISASEIYRQQEGAYKAFLNQAGKDPEKK
ncbi:MAG TPA: TetR/AcrR family transcriptional regulator [Candidatus Scybalocola faecavium]|nr:TetR/AcrR family transcriptional regulator [Candidatus Scybalocola faecavium]